MNQDSLRYFEYKGEELEEKDGNLFNSQGSFPIRNEIPRFSPDMSYSTGNFAKLREEHANLQIDSLNGTDHRLRTILDRTNWPESFFKGKTILECGCGAGPDTEILTSLGAKVISADIAGLDVAKKNLKNNPNAQFIQADITNLPLKKKSFDIVYCHRVLQHTPNPEQTLNHILGFVKDDGAVFVHSYARTPYQMLRWKYFLRPITKRMNAEFLYKFIKFYSKPAFYITSAIEKIPFVGSHINYLFMPFLNYRYNKKFKDKSNEYIIEYGVHDTFDALSPKYDSPMSAKKMREIAVKYLKKPFEIFEHRSITLLRTKVGT